MRVKAIWIVCVDCFVVMYLKECNEKKLVFMY